MQGVFSVFYSFLNHWLIYLFVNAPKTKEQFSAFNLFQSTFRIAESERKRPLLVFWQYASLIKLLFKPKVNSQALISETKGGAYLYDASRSAYSLRKDYVNYFSGKDTICGGIFKEELYYSSSFYNNVVLFFLLSAWLPFLLIHSLFKKDKAPIAMLFREMGAVINLLALCHEFGIHTIYYFCIYEKDSNISTLLLNRSGVKVNKITSEVPLSIWNKTIIADNLYICSGYQNDELKNNSRSVFASNVELWGPERMLDNVSKYQFSVPPNKNSIGFYSTGGWVRKLENHMDQNADLEKLEEQVKQVLKRFCLSNREYQLIIFLHPREKWEKYRKQTTEKYKKDFEGVNYLLETDSSTLTFEKADLGIAFFSTILFERLYYGYKTLIMPIDLGDKFPVKNSNIFSLCAYTADDLSVKINRSASLSNIDFFRTNRVEYCAKYLYN